MKPGTTNVDTVVTRRQALITLSQGLSQALLIDIIYFLVAGVATQTKDQRI
jgi:hypothetical protein